MRAIVTTCESPWATRIRNARANLQGSIYGSASTTTFQVSHCCERPAHNYKRTRCLYSVNAKSFAATHEANWQSRMPQSSVAGFACSGKKADRTMRKRADLEPNVQGGNRARQILLQDWPELSSLGEPLN